MSSEALNLPLQKLIDLLPMAAYAVRAPDGDLAWYNERAAELWGRRPNIGDLDERFCGSYRLYRQDGTYMAHCDTPVAQALITGASLHRQDVIIERPDGTWVVVCVHIDAVRGDDGTIVGVTNFFYDVTERRLRESDAELNAVALKLALNEKTRALRMSQERLAMVASLEPTAESQREPDGAPTLPYSQGACN